MRTLFCWTNWLLQDVLRGKPVVFVNLDETAVSFAIARRAGNVVKCPRGGARDIHYERIARRESHGHLTLVANITSTSALQKHLPQILLTRDESLSVAEQRLLRALPPPLYWFPGSSGWVTKENFPSILTMLRRSIVAHVPGAEVVVLLDSAAQHVNTQVIGHAARLQIHLIFVPARSTWLLQPLDTHVFGLFKRELHRLQLQARSESVTGTLERVAWVSLLQDAVHNVLVARCWAHAFQGNGLCGHQHRLRERISDACGSLFPIRQRAPSDEELHELLGRAIPAASARVLSRARRLLSAALEDAAEGEPAAEPLPPLPPPAEPPPEESASSSAPIASRTRSRTALLGPMAM